MSPRLEKFESFKEHVIQGKLYRKLSAFERAQCRAFIHDTDHLDDHAYAAKCNRWFLDQPKPENFSTMWALVLQANTTSNLNDLKKR